MSKRVIGTGIGSMPGVNFAQTLDAVFATLPQLPFVPELPARGPGADMIGRSAGMLAELAVDLQPEGWRLVSRAGREARRTAAMLQRDRADLADFIGRQAVGFSGPLKIQVAGPWTLAASLVLPRGNRVLTDAGAARDVVQALAFGLAEQVQAFSAATGGIRLVVQLDEPSLPAVLAGKIPTASGLGTLHPVSAEEAIAAVRSVVNAVRSAVVNEPIVIAHCCAPAAPMAVFAEAGVAAISFDASLNHDREAMAAAVDSGIALWPGLVPALPASVSTSRNTTAPAADFGGLSGVSRTVTQVRQFYTELGFAAPPASSADCPVAITPTCGMAGASSDYAVQTLRYCETVAQSLTEEWELA